MRQHADRKSILEVEFIDEEGTGLDPQLVFFALVAAAFQRADLAMWLSATTWMDALWKIFQYSPGSQYLDTRYIIKILLDTF